VLSAPSYLAGADVRIGDSSSNHVLKRGVLDLMRHSGLEVLPTRDAGDGVVGVGDVVAGGGRHVVDGVNGDGLLEEPPVPSFLL